MNEKFELHIQVGRWVENLKSEPSFTESDSEELKCHLLDLIDELKTAGLDEDEAFLIASKRLGNASEWEDDFYQSNNHLIQMGRSLVILGGFLAYCILNYLIRWSTKLYFLLLRFHHVTGFKAVDKVFDVILGSQLLLGLLFLYIFLFGRKIVQHIDYMKSGLSPVYVIFMLATAVVFGITDSFLFRVVKDFESNVIVKSHLFHGVYRNFDFTFPLIFCIGFILLYSRYYRKRKL